MERVQQQAILDAMGIPVWVERRQRDPDVTESVCRYLILIISETNFRPHQGARGELLDNIISAMKLSQDECQIRMIQTADLPEDVAEFHTVFLFGAQAHSHVFEGNCLCLPSLQDMNSDRSHKKQAWSLIQHWLSTHPKA